MRITKLLCLAAIPFLSQTAFANTIGVPSGNVTIGIDVISDSGTQTFHRHSETIDSDKLHFSGNASGVRLRLQTKVDKNNALEFYLLSYDAVSEFKLNGGNALDLGVGLVISGNPGPVAPFGKLNLGIGFAPATFANAGDEYITNFHAGAALGATFALTEHLSIVGSIEVIYRGWESITYSSGPYDGADISDDISRTSLGIEYSF